MSHSDAKATTDKAAHPTVATILSISGSMSNLSFADSTYFSDAEMEARAPELYQQYIGRFMDDDNEERDDEEDKDDDEDEGGYADDEREQVEPFGKEVGLVDRILWNIDHPSKHQLKRERQERKDHQNQYQEAHHHHHENANGIKKDLSVPRPTAMPNEVSEEELEEEFDTESEVDEDTEMPLKDSDATGGAKEVDQDSHRGPLAYVPDSEIRARTSVTPRLPPKPKRPDLVSSTMASAAFTLEQPEERAIFAEVENGNDDSEQGEEDERTEHRKEDQEALRCEFVLLMKQRFLDGLDVSGPPSSFFSRKCLNGCGFLWLVFYLLTCYYFLFFFCSPTLITQPSISTRTWTIWTRKPMTKRTGTLMLKTSSMTWTPSGPWMETTRPRGLVPAWRWSPTAMATGGAGYTPQSMPTTRARRIWAA